MGDIQRGYNEIVEASNELKSDFIKIQINEKKAQEQQLKLNLDKLKSIEMKKIELQLKILEKEIEELEAMLTASTDAVVDAEFTNE